jgi:hypothetical protein
LYLAYLLQGKEQLKPLLLLPERQFKIKETGRQFKDVEVRLGFMPSRVRNPSIILEMT